MEEWTVRAVEDGRLIGRWSVREANEVKRFMTEHGVPCTIRDVEGDAIYCAELAREEGGLH